MSKPTMSKRMMITLPDSVYAELDEWAKDESRPIANLVAFIVEKGVRERVTLGGRKTEKDESQKKSNS